MIDKTNVTKSEKIAVVIPELNGAKIRKTEDGRFSVYDLIRIAGGQKNPRDTWKSICEHHSEVVGKTDNFQFVGKGQRNTPVATMENCLYILGLLPGECGKSYREKAANLVRRYIEGDADLGMDAILRDHNKERVERAKRRLDVSEINKQVQKMASDQGVHHGQVHNTRYLGLYGKNAQQLRSECGAKEKETPLNYMSSRDLQLNNLSNCAAIEAGDVGRVGLAAQLFRNAFEQASGKTLTPEWTESCLPPSKARKFLADGQLEFPC
jgi:hypothetical protein